MTDTVLQKARTFLYRNARPLDIARWQYHFEDGSRAAVLTALSAYQNEDGGFGHALEPDAWNPNSSPIQTWAATEILREIGWTDGTHPLVSGILRYLASGQDFDGHVWTCTIGSNNDYPHAPWWHSESESACNGDYNPAAAFSMRTIKRSLTTSVRTSAKHSLRTAPGTSHGAGRSMMRNGQSAKTGGRATARC